MFFWDKMDNYIDGRRKALLIIECGSLKLSSQGLALGDGLQSSVQLAFPRNTVDQIKSYETHDLLEKLGKLRGKGKPYRDIVVIGHSNEQGLQISSDRFDDWPVIANWIEPFKPHRIFLIACHAGRWLPCASLFNGIPTLKEIFGSPVPANRDQVYFVMSLVLHRLGAKKIDAEFVKLMQGINLLTTQGLMFSRTRREYEQDGVVDGVFWTITDRILSQIVAVIRSRA
jgi:hypothetical protein